MRIRYRTTSGASINARWRDDGLVTIRMGELDPYTVTAKKMTELIESGELREVSRG